MPITRFRPAAAIFAALAVLLAASPALADELNSGDTAWMLTSTAIV